MSKVKLVTDKGTVITEGMRGTLNKKADKKGIGWEGLKLTVKVVNCNSYEGHRIGIQSDEPVQIFHNMDERTPEHTGYWLEKHEIDEYINFEPSNYFVKGDFIFKDKNLKGRKCKVLGAMSNKEYMVEFDDNIKGTSGDGLGKKGHCIPVAISLLGNKPIKAKTASGNGDGDEDE